MMEENATEYSSMEANRFSLQVAFAVLYIGFALIVLLAAIWTAIAVADRIVRPIRLLITAADSVASGNMDIVVPVHAVDGDVANLSRTFNKMISEIRTQRDEILRPRTRSTTAAASSRRCFRASPPLSSASSRTAASPSSTVRPRR